MATRSRILVRPIGQKHGGTYHAIPCSVEEIRAFLEGQGNKDITLYNADLGELTDTTLLRDGDIVYFRSPNNNEQSEFPRGRLEPLLQFMTGYVKIPPLGLPKLTIDYLNDDDTEELPCTKACFGIIKLPVIHSTEAMFSKAMDKALIFGALGFGSL